MALNNLGLGFLFTAKDLASGVMSRVRNNFVQTEGVTSEAAKNIGQSFATFGTGMAIFGAGVAGLAIVGGTLGSASLFGQKIGEISTLTEEATLNTSYLSSEVLALNAAYGGSTAVQAKALYDGISAGAADASAASALLTASNKLAVAGVTEVNIALDGLTSSLNAYGTSFSEAESFSDAMFVAVRKGKTTIAELSSVIGRVAPTASALGISFDDVTAALAAITTKGLKTEEAATGIKAALANMIKPTKEAEDEAKRLGIEFSAAAVRAKGLPAFIDSITGAADFNDDSLSKLFGSVEALNAMLAITAGDSKAFKDTLDAMAEKTGKTDGAFKIMSNTLAFQGKRFAGLRENASIAIGQALEPMGAAALRFVNVLLEGFGRIPKPVRDFVVQIFAGASAVIALVGAVVAAKAAFGMMNAGLAAAGISLKGLLATASPAVVVIGLLAVAAAGLKYAIDHNIGGIGDTFHSAFAKVKLAFQALGQLFTDGAFSGTVLADLENGNKGVEDFAITVFLWVNRIKNFFTGIGDGFSETLKGLEPAFADFKSALGDLGDAFGMKDAPGVAKGKFDEFGAAGSSLGVFLGRVAEVLLRVSTAGLKVATAITPIVGIATGLIDSLGGVETVAKLLEIALVALAAHRVASVAVTLAGVGVEAVAAAAGLWKTVAAASAAGAFGWAQLAATIGGALKTLGASAAAAMGPVAAATAAIVALYLAYTQWLELEKQMANDDGTAWNKFKYDIGYSTEAEYLKGMGIRTGDEYVGMSVAPPAPITSQAPPMMSMMSASPPAQPPPPQPGGGMMSIDPAATAELQRAAAALQAVSSQPSVTNVTLTMDSEVLASVSAKGGRDEAGRSFAP